MFGARMLGGGTEMFGARMLGGGTEMFGARMLGSGAIMLGDECDRGRGANGAMGAKTMVGAGAEIWDGNKWETNINLAFFPPAFVLKPFIN